MGHRHPGASTPESEATERLSLLDSLLEAAYAIDNDWQAWAHGLARAAGRWPGCLLAAAGAELGEDQHVAVVRPDGEAMGQKDLPLARALLDSACRLPTGVHELECDVDEVAQAAALFSPGRPDCTALVFRTQGPPSTRTCLVILARTGERDGRSRCPEPVFLLRHLEKALRVRHSLATVRGTRARRPARPPDRPTTNRLTPRELEVFRASRKGETSKEIAAMLGIAHSTVRVLLARARAKLARRDGKPDRSEGGSSG